VIAQLEFTRLDSERARNSMRYSFPEGRFEFCHLGNSKKDESLKVFLKSYKNIALDLV
jgi:hypothetical protein